MKLSKILFPLCLIAAFSIECSSGSDSTDNPSDTPQPTPEPTQTDTTSSKPEPPVVDLDTCELASYSLFVDCMGGEEVIIVKSNRSYTVVPTVDWITVKESRAVTESEVTIQIAENTEAERKGIVEFVMNDTQEPITLQFVVEQTAAGVQFEDETVNEAVNDMNQSVWHPNEVTYTYGSAASFHYGLSQYSDKEPKTCEIPEDHFREFFGIEGSIEDLIESGKMKCEILWCSTNGTEWKVTSVKAPLLPEGYEFGASYRNTGGVIPETSTFETLYTIGMKSPLQIVLEVNYNAIEFSVDEYYAGVRYSMVDETWGDTYIYDAEISFTYKDI